MAGLHLAPLSCAAISRRTHSLHYCAAGWV